MTVQTPPTFHRKGFQILRIYLASLNQDLASEHKSTSNEPMRKRVFDFLSSLTIVNLQHIVFFKQGLPLFDL